MKKLTSLALCAILASSMTAMSAFAQEAAAEETKEEEAAVEVDTSNVVQVNVMDGLCTLIDNAATNHQASDYALCFAEAYGTGRTTEDDAVTWEDVTFEKDVKQVAIKCGYNLSNKPDTATEFWLYLDKIEGEPLAKVTVTNKVGEENYTASSQIVDQIYRLADVDIKAGTYDVIVVGKTEFSGSVSQVKFITDAEIVDDATLAAAVKVEADEIAAKKAEEKAKEEAKKAEEEAKKAEEEAKANEANNADDNKDDNTNDDNDKNDNEENNNANNNANKTSGDFDDWWIIAIVVVVVVVIAAVVVAGKKKKQ